MPHQSRIRAGTNRLTVTSLTEYSDKQVGCDRASFGRRFIAGMVIYARMSVYKPHLAGFRAASPKRTHFFNLRVDSIDGAQPRPGERLCVGQIERRRSFISRILVNWAHDNSKSGRPPLAMVIDSSDVKPTQHDGILGLSYREDNRHRI